MTHTTDTLRDWQARAVALALNAIKISYEAHGFDDIAPLDEATLIAGLADDISEATYPAYRELNDPPDIYGTEADKAWEERKERMMGL